MSNWKSISTFVEFTTKGVTPKYVETSSIIVLNQKCIRNNKIDYSFSQFTDDTKNISEKKFVKKGDILVNSTGTGTAGRCAFVETVPQNNRLIVDSHILILRCNSFYEAQCLSYCLFSFEKTLMSFMTGSSGQSELDKVVLLNIKTKLSEEPATQKKIAHILSTLDSKIELNNRINSELEKMAKTLYDYWFVQFDFPDENGKPYKSSGGKMVFDEKLKRKIPAGWEVGTLNDCIDFKRGISYTKKDISEKNGIPLVNLNSFNLSGKYKSAGLKNYSGKYKKEALLETGDLIIAITDVTRNADIIGRAFMLPDLFNEKPLMSCDIASVIILKHLTPEYLEMLFNSQYYHDYIKYFSSGTLVLHLNLDGIKWYKTFFPPVNLLKQFSEMKNEISKKITLNQLENQKLAELRDFLLPMLMNGQVEVE